VVVMMVMAAVIVAFFVVVQVEARGTEGAWRMVQWIVES